MTRRLKIVCGNSAAMLLASNLELLQPEFGTADNFEAHSITHCRHQVQSFPAPTIDQSVTLNLTLNITLTIYLHFHSHYLPTLSLSTHLVRLLPHLSPISTPFVCNNNLLLSQPHQPSSLITTTTFVYYNNNNLRPL